jgi:NTP pyrophosphatase (non-canonical NTP hydrolase)
MELKDLQEKVLQFDQQRGWDNDWNLKDLCLNMNEEIGEFWNLIKWVDDDKQKEIINNNKEEADNFIGDSLFIVLKIANQLGADAETELQKVLVEYDQRMPAEKMKEIGTANKLAGGWDNKQILNSDYLDALKEISERLNQSEIEWSFIGSMSRYLQGMKKIPNDIDILVSYEDLNKASSLFEDFGDHKFTPMQDHTKLVFAINGIQIEICGEHPDGIYSVVGKDYNARKIKFNNLLVNCFPIEAEAECYQKLGRPEKAEEIKNFIQENEN